MDILLPCVVSNPRGNEPCQRPYLERVPSRDSRKALKVSRFPPQYTTGGYPEPVASYLESDGEICGEELDGIRVLDVAGLVPQADAVTSGRPAEKIAGVPDGDQGRIGELGFGHFERPDVPTRQNLRSRGGVTHGDVAIAAPENLAPLVTVDVFLSFRQGPHRGERHGGILDEHADRRAERERLSPHRDITGRPAARFQGRAETGGS